MAAQHSRKTPSPEPEYIGRLYEHVEVWKVPLGMIREQDVNAQVMAPEMLQHLSDTIKREGALEQIPYAVRRTPTDFELISGHHRIRAARMAGVQVIPLEVDTRDLTRDQVVAKQIAHNTISGEPDPDVLRRMYLGMEDVNARIEAFVDEAKLNIRVDHVPIKLDDIQVPFDWHYVVLAFLPNQHKDWQRVVRHLPKNAESIGVIDDAVFCEFQKVARAVGLTEDIVAVGAIMVKLIDIAREWLDAHHPDWQKSAEPVGSEEQTT